MQHYEVWIQIFFLLQNEYLALLYIGKIKYHPSYHSILGKIGWKWYRKLKNSTIFRNVNVNFKYLLPGAKYIGWQ